jgi:hypothetical protein
MLRVGDLLSGGRNPHTLCNGNRQQTNHDNYQYGCFFEPQILTR